MQTNKKLLFRKNIVLLLLTSTVVADVELAVPLIPQETDFTCWAACCRMVLRGFNKTNNGSYYTEMDIRNYATGGQAIGNALYGRSLACDGVLTHFGQILSVGGSTPLTFDEANRTFTLKKEIDAGRPIMIRRSRGLDDHIVCIIGYKNDGRVVWNDPWWRDGNQNPIGGMKYTLPYTALAQDPTDATSRWTNTLRLTTNDRVPAVSGTGPNEALYITSTSATEITQNPQTLTFTAQKWGTHVPVTWDWKLVFSSPSGYITAAQWSFSSTAFTSTWNIPNFVLPSGYYWDYTYEGKIPGRLEVTVNDNAGPPAHFDAIDILYRPANLYPGSIMFQNQTVLNSQPEVKVHQSISALNDMFTTGGNITFRAGAQIDIGDGVTLQNGSNVTFVVDPSIQ